MAEPLVLIERAGKVGTVVLNRPARLNAIDDQLGQELERALIALACDSSIRAIVLTGAAGHFCAGGDVARLAEILGDRGSQLADRDPDLDQPQFARLGSAGRLYHSRYLLPAAIGKPVIAAIEGACAGAGLVLAISCDMRVVAQDAKITAGFAQRGLIAESGIAQLITRIGGSGVAARLLIACERIDGVEAHRCHLAEYLTPSGKARSAAQAIANRIAGDVSPRSVSVIKRQLQDQFAAVFSNAVRSDFRAMMQSFSSPDFAEGLTSFRDHRPPCFADWQETDR